VPARTLLTNTDEAIEEVVQANFFSDFRKFYCAVVQKNMKILPFDDRVINNLVVMDPTKRDELTWAPIVRLIERFVLVADQEVLKEEFEFFQLMEVTEIGVEEGAVQKSVDRYWGEFMKINTAIGQMRFPELAQVMVAVLSLPHSNADCRKAFSFARKLHTECL